MRHRYIIAAVLLVAAGIIAADYWFFEGLYLVGPALTLGAYFWRGILYAFEFLVRTFAYQLGLRRLIRPVSVITMGGVGLTYLLTNPKLLQRTRGWKGSIARVLVVLGEWWRRRHFLTKLGIVSALICAQVALHFWILLFPVGFLIAGIAYLIERGRVAALDAALDKWYWTRLRDFHRGMMKRIRPLFGVRHCIGASRWCRLFFLGGWRLWRYDPRFRDPFASGKGHPVEGRYRLFLALMRGEWKRYCGRPLLAGNQNWPEKKYVPHLWYAIEDPWYEPFVSTAVIMLVTLLGLDYVTGANVIPNAYHNTLASWR